MNNIKNISIKQYLENKGITPVINRNYYGMYVSPFRNDNNPSFKVDYAQNLWHDFGTGEGGSIIDLVMKMDQCSFAEAIQKLENVNPVIESFSFHRDIKNPVSKEQAINILSIAPLNHTALLEYLKERKINTEIAKIHCSEVHYEVNGKPYFAIGYKNDSGGYELRNKYFKGCTSKDITSAKAGNDTCQLFEGFMDYLSFLTIKNWQKSPVDVIVLNSLTNLPKIENTLSSYQHVATFFDNDDAGKKATQEIKSVCKSHSDQSDFYKNYKDLNDYLCNRSVPKQSVKKKPSRGMRI